MATQATRWPDSWCTGLCIERSGPGSSPYLDGIIVLCCSGERYFTVTVALPIHATEIGDKRWPDGPQISTLTFFLYRETGNN